MLRLAQGRRYPYVFTLFDKLFALTHCVGDTKAVRPIRLNVTALEDRIVPEGRPYPLPTLMVASGTGSAPLVRDYNAETGGTNFSAQPFESAFTGGESVASADFNGDGIPDLVVAAGKGGGPRVRIYDGATGLPMTSSPLNDFWAFEQDFTGGVEVATGDVNGDGISDIIAVPGPGGGPRVRVFSGATGDVIGDFWAFDQSFTGGLHVAAGDFNMDNKADIVVAAGAGGGPRISIFEANGTMLPNKLDNFFAFNSNDRAGVYVAVADVNGDTLPDIIVGSGAGDDSTVRVFNGRDGSLMTDRPVFGDGNTAGVRVGSAYVNDDPYADVIVASGPGSGAGQVQIYAGGTDSLAGTPLDNLTPFTGDSGGVMIAAANDPGTGTTTIGSEVYDPGDSIERGEQFSVSATVTSTSASYVPTGMLDFYAEPDGTSTLIPLGSGLMTAISGTYSASAQVTVKDLALPANTYDIIASYQGDSNFASNDTTLTTQLDSTTTSTLPVSTPSEACSCTTGNQQTQMTPGSGTNATVTSVGAGGINLLDGSIKLVRTDMTSDGFALPWSSTWLWTNAQGVTNGVAGNNAQMGPMPVLKEINGTDSLAYVQNGQVQFFDKLGGVYVARFGEDYRLVYDSVAGQYDLYDGSGNCFVFFDFSYSTTALQGTMEKYLDTTGNEIDVASWNSDGNPTELTRSETVGRTTTTESWLYDYIASGVNAGLLDSVTLERQVGSGSWETVRSVSYTYYDGSQTYGLAGDLMFATVLDGDSNVIDQSYYRYYTKGTGYANALKYVFGPAAYARLVADQGSDVDSLDDSTVSPYADDYLEYNTSQQVSKIVVAGEGCSACTGGQGEYDYAYTENTSNIGGSNIWRYKTVETLPDGGENDVYMDANGEVMLWGSLNAATSTDNYQFQEFNGTGQVIRYAEPSAVDPGSVSGGIESHDDLLDDAGGNYYGLRDSSGELISYKIAATTTATTTTSGNVANFVYISLLLHGETASFPPAISSETYIVHTSGSQDYYFPATSTVYRNDDSTGAETTTTSYTWQSYAGSSSARPATVTVRAPAVTTAENGSNATTSTSTGYDSHGWPIWTKDQAGIINFEAYDLETGSPTEQVQDVGSASGLGTLPSGWSILSGSHLQLTTTETVDSLGRTTSETSPAGRVDYTVYDDPDHESRYYPAWNSSTNTPTGPTTVTLDDQVDGYTETMTVSTTPNLTSGLPDGTESIAIGDVQTLSRSNRNDAGQVVSTDDYFSFTGMSDPTDVGTQNTNFYRTEYGYSEHAGLQDKVVTPAGTITRTEYDTLGRAISVWVGTDDTPTTGYWSPTNLAGTNMVEVSSYVYDGGGVGDGNLTQETDYPNGSTNPRVTDYFYDWRDRQVAVKEGVQTTESTSVNRPITYTNYDNLNEATEQRMYDGDGVSITSTGGVPNAPSASLLRAQTVTSYDELGQAYETQTFSVDPTSGSVSTYALTSEVWYDSRGNVVKESEPGGLVTKTVYDTIDRPVTTYTSDGGGDSGYSDAFNVTGDTVLEQDETTYDVDGNVTETVDRQRLPGASGTGALGTPTSGIAARDSYMGYYYDLADRPVTTIYVGTNGGTAWTLPSSPSARTADVLRTDTTYDAAGRVFSVTDPKGLVTLNYYDALGETTETIENYIPPAPPGPPPPPLTSDEDKTTEYTYGPAGMTSLTAVNPSSVNQTTAYVYGVTTGTGNGIDSNDIVSATEWPNLTTGAASSSLEDVTTVDALGEPITSTDRNGNVHTYTYDVLGRQTSDTVTTLGSGVDGSVRRIDTAYDAQGNPYLTTSYSNTSGTTVVNQVEDVYNGLGQMTGEYQAVGGTVNTSTTPEVQYGYSEMSGGANNSRPTSLTYPNGRVINDTYGSGLDSDISRLTSMTDSGTTLESYTYMGLGTVVERDHPESGVNQTYITSSVGDAGDDVGGLDRFGRVVDQNRTNGTSSTDDFQYTYDRDSNRLTTTNTLKSAFDETYSYDGLNQITGFTQGSSHTQAFVYDSLGNRTSLTTDGGTAQTSTFNAQNEITAVSGATSPVYDANGNMTTDQTGQQYVYDAWNRLVTVKNSGGTTIASYTYDGMSRRVSQTESGTTTDLYYSSDDQVLEERVGGTTVTQYVWSPVYVNAMVERDDSTGGGTLNERLYVQQDANWNVTALVNTSGTVVERYTYDPFGTFTVRNDDSTWSAKSGGTVYAWTYEYQGMRYDLYTGQVLSDTRDYNSTLGRWDRSDPIGYVDGTNIYAMTQDNPIIRTDPSGLEFISPGLISGIPSGLPENPYIGQEREVTSDVKIVGKEFYNATYVVGDNGCSCGLKVAYRGIESWGKVTATYKYVSQSDENQGKIAGVQASIAKLEARKAELQQQIAELKLPKEGYEGGGALTGPGILWGLGLLNLGSAILGMEINQRESEIGEIDTNLGNLNGQLKELVSEKKGKWILLGISHYEASEYHYFTGIITEIIPMDPKECKGKTNGQRASLSENPDLQQYLNGYLHGGAAGATSRYSPLDPREGTIEDWLGLND